MIPRVPETNGGVGMSFKGTAAYLLHDEGHAKTDERVMWTETRNVGTDDPELASRIMAATALSADHLKRAHHEAEQQKLPADERKPYRSSKPAKNHVWHFSLSWSGEHEGHTLTREEMTRAADAALRHLKADHLQAFIVAHESPSNPHVHVCVNRVNPITGKTETPESNAQRHLSRWALQYEKDRGQILCPQRERNAMFREVGTRYTVETISPQDHRARAPAADEIAANPQAAKRFAVEQKALDKALSDATKSMQRRQKAELDTLFKDHNRRKAAINRFAHQNRDQSERQTKAEYNPRFLHQKSEQEQRMDQFIEREATMFGKLRNIRDALNTTWEERQGSARGVLSDAMNVIANAPERVLREQKKHDRERAALKSQMNADIAAGNAIIEAERKASIDTNYQRLQDERSDMLQRHAEEKAHNADEWSDRGNDRIDAWQEFAAQQRLEKGFDDATGGSGKAPHLQEREGEAVEQFQAASEQDNYLEDEQEGDSRPLTPKEQARADQFSKDLSESTGQRRVIPRAKVEKALEQKQANERSNDNSPDLSED